MELTNKKRFPIKIDSKEAAQIFKDTFKKKGFNYEIKKEDLYLTVTPYWISFYDILINKNGDFNHINDQIALNSINNKINEKVIEIFSLTKPIISEKIDVPKTEKTQIIIKDTIVTQEEAEKTIKKYLMYKHNVSEENISLSGIEEIFVPNWKVKVDKYKLKMDSVKGVVNNFEIIKKRDKNKIELVREVFTDLKKTENVGEYSKSFLKTLFEGITLILKGVYKNYKIILWVVIVALIIYLLLL